MKCLKCLFLANRASCHRCAVQIDVMSVICSEARSSDMCWAVESCDQMTSPSGKTSAFHLQRHHQRLGEIFFPRLYLFTFIDFFSCHSTFSDFSSFPGKRRTFLSYLQSLFVAFTRVSALISSHFRGDARITWGDKKPLIKTVKEMRVVLWSDHTVLYTWLRLLAVRSCSFVFLQEDCLYKERRRWRGRWS